MIESYSRTKRVISRGTCEFARPIFQVFAASYASVCLRIACRAEEMVLQPRQGARHLTEDWSDAPEGYSSYGYHYLAG
jgi:hypothetical protein